MGNNTKQAHNPPPHHAEELQNLREDDDQQFTCEICIGSTASPHKNFKNGDKCAHPLCDDCVIEYIRVKLEDEYTGHIKCPAPNCDHTLDPLACSSLVGPSLFLRWCDVLCEEAIAGRVMCYCPYRDCNVLILNECGGDLGQSRCPNCKRLFCFRCKTFCHPRLTCRENRNDEDLRMLAAQKRWKSCPSCGIFIERVGGCSGVKCRCGISFCHNCGRQDLLHFCSEPPLMFFLLFILLLAVSLFAFVGILVYSSSRN